MELEILVLPDPNPIGVQVCDDAGGGACPYNWCKIFCLTDEPKYWPAY